MWSATYHQASPSIVLVPWEHYQRATAWKTRECVSNLETSAYRMKILLALTALGARSRRRC